MPAAVNIYYAALIFWWIIEVWIILRDIGKARIGKDNFSTIIIIIMVVVGNYLGNTLGNITYHPIFGSSSQHFIIGSVLIILGVGIRIWSVVALGKFFRITVMVQKGHRVITHGPYTYIRHPSYLGILIAILGAGFGIENWLGLFYLFIFIFLGLEYRMSVEEKVLQSELGKRYKDYMKKTKKLIPLVY